MNRKANSDKIIKIILLLVLVTNDIEKKYLYSSNKNDISKLNINSSLVKIFISTHKDFANNRYNPIYNIVVDDRNVLKNKYNLNIIYANESKLYNLRRGYGEMSKLYFIYQLYKKKTINSKYIGLNHYKRYFVFGDNIPDLDSIFENHDVILNKKNGLKRGLMKQYCISHICRNFVEILNIIKDIKPNYYKIALKTAQQRSIYYSNLFIMKKEDFFKYCEFIYDVLFEFDKRNNFKSDNDILLYSKQFFNNSKDYYYQSRLQGFLAERIGNIFFNQHFKKIKTFRMITFY